MVMKHRGIELIFKIYLLGNKNKKNLFEFTGK